MLFIWLLRYPVKYHHPAGNVSTFGSDLLNMVAKFSQRNEEHISAYVLFIEGSFYNQNFSHPNRVLHPPPKRLRKVYEKRKPQFQVIFGQDSFPPNTSLFIPTFRRTLTAASFPIGCGMSAFIITLFTHNFLFSQELGLSHDISLLSN